MKKAIKILATIALAGILAIAGVLAAASYDLTTTATVNFISTHAAVKVTGEINNATATVGGTLEETFSYDTDNYTAAEEMEAWDNIVISDFTDYIEFIFEIENVGSRGVLVSFSSSNSAFDFECEFESDASDSSQVLEHENWASTTSDAVGFLSSGTQTSSDDGYTATLTVTATLKNNIHDITIGSDVSFTLSFDVAPHDTFAEFKTALDG